MLPSGYVAVFAGAAGAEVTGEAAVDDGGGKDREAHLPHRYRLPTCPASAGLKGE